MSRVPIAMLFLAAGSLHGSYPLVTNQELTIAQKHKTGIYPADQQCLYKMSYNAGDLVPTLSANHGYTYTQKHRLETHTVQLI